MEESPPDTSNGSLKGIPDERLSVDKNELSLVEIIIGIIDVLTEETWCVWVSTSVECFGNLSYENWTPKLVRIFSPLTNLIMPLFLFLSHSSHYLLVFLFVLWLFVSLSLVIVFMVICISLTAPISLLNPNMATLAPSHQVLVNTAYCVLILVGKLIQHLIFGELRVAEAQHLKDRFWNFVFYKFIFIFGVLNVQHLGEVLTWG